jgi:hypothetical protein
MLVIDNKEILRGVRGDICRKLRGVEQALFEQSREVFPGDCKHPFFAVQQRFHGSTRAELFQAVKGVRRGR